MRDLAHLEIVLKRIWCWTDGCLLSRLQRRGNVVPAWIVVIAHWTTVSILLVQRRDCSGVTAGVSASYTVPACFIQGPTEGYHGSLRYLPLAD